MVRLVITHLLVYSDEMHTHITHRLYMYTDLYNIYKDVFFPYF